MQRFWGDEGESKLEGGEALVTSVLGQIVKIGLVASLAAGMVSVSHADDAGAQATPVERRSRDVLAHIDDPRDASREEPGWMSRYVSLDVKSGVRVQRHFSLAGRSVFVRLRGPVIRSAMRKKKFGARLEFRF